MNRKSLLAGSLIAIGLMGCLEGPAGPQGPAGKGGADGKDGRDAADAAPYDTIFVCSPADTSMHYFDPGFVPKDWYFLYYSTKQPDSAGTPIHGVLKMSPEYIIEKGFAFGCVSGIDSIEVVYRK